METPIYNKDAGTITGVIDGGYLIVIIQIKKTVKGGDAKYELINQSVYYSSTLPTSNENGKELIQNLIDDVKTINNNPTTLVTYDAHNHYNGQDYDTDYFESDFD